MRNTMHPCDTSFQHQGTEEGIKDLLKAERHFRGGKDMLDRGRGRMVKKLIMCCTDKP